MICEILAKRSLISIVTVTFVLFSFSPAMAQSNSKSENNSNKTTETIDLYYDGWDAAKRDYNSGGAFLGGLLSGAGLGLIGLGVGYVLVSNMGVEVPHKYISNLETKPRFDFEDGYSAYVKKRRKAAFTGGAIVGTFAIVVVLVTSSKK